MSHHDEYHHDSLTSLALLGVLGAVLTLPSNILRRALKRLAILVGGFIAIIAIIGGAYAVFTPAAVDCKAGLPLARQPPFCKPPATIPLSQRTKICKKEFEDLIPGSDCHQP
jgi:hypothetical protein